jgi:hypothetical protein
MPGVRLHKVGRVAAASNGALSLPCKDTREDRHAIPALLAAAYRMIACLPERLRRKLGVPAFEFLKAHRSRAVPPEANETGSPSDG